MASSALFSLWLIRIIAVIERKMLLTIVSKVLLIGLFKLLLFGYLRDLKLVFIILNLVLRLDKPEAEEANLKQKFFKFLGHFYCLIMIR